MTSRPTVAQHQLEPKSGKIITHFGNRSVFIVYVKRHNGRKIIVHMGTGDQLKEVLDFYNSYEIYRHDRKYLCHRMDDEPLEKETKVSDGKRQGGYAYSHAGGTEAHRLQVQ
jgi:hypothetical protein